MVIARGVLLGALLVLAPAPLLAQWSVDEEPGEDGDTAGIVAHGRNGDGDTLKIRLTDEGTVEAVFALRPGLSPLADGCPSYRVDSERPRPLVSNGDMCQPEGRSVTFVLGHVRDDEVDSEPLLEMMNGSRMRFIYHVRAAGYDEAAFSLSGSKQAINEVLGDEVTVNGD